VCMSTYASNIHNCLFWASEIKKLLPNATMAIGGNHASYMGPEILEKCPAVDIVVRFEGEIPFKMLCDKLEKGDKDFSNIPSAAFRRGAKIVETVIAPLLEDLDTLPILNRDFFSGSSPEHFTHADVTSARGCPFHCTFCNCNHYWGKKYRAISPQRVVDELSRLKQRAPDLKTVRFRDEAISISRKHCLGLCDMLEKAKLGLEFHAHSRLDGLTEEVIERMAMAGFKQLYIGLESGSQAVLDRLKKGIDVKNVHAIVPILRKHGINFRFSLMLCTPGETLEEAGQTIELVNALDLSFDEFYFGFGIVIYPGTTDCETFLRKFPNYRWLDKQELGDGYSQRLDLRGNVVEVSCHGAMYELEDLHNEIDRRLKRKLGECGESNYRKLNAARNALENLTISTGGKERAIRTLGDFLDTVDAQGQSWGVYGSGFYFQELFSGILQERAFKNYAGAFSDVSDREKLRTLEHIVLALSEHEVHPHYVSLESLHAAGFRGDWLLPDELLHSRDAGPEGVIELATFQFGKYRLRHQVRGILGRIGMLGVAERIANKVRGA
ncbi:B12-binding domain-containing radical SAM protein, partial [Candidatus Hydrogenedentota bacterium]